MLLRTCARTAPHLVSFSPTLSIIRRPTSAVSHYRGSASGPAAACLPTPELSTGSGLRSNGVFYTEDMLVRDSELDAFGVVNNSVFSVYTQHARHEALAAMGFPVDAFAQAGTPLALSEMRFVYLQPLRSRDRFVVSVRVLKVTAARVVLQQEVLRLPKAPHPQDFQGGGVVVVRAEATVVFLKASYQPGRVPADARAVLEHMQGLSDAAP